MGPLWFGKVVMALSDVAVQLVDELPPRILKKLKKLPLRTWEVTVKKLSRPLRNCICFAKEPVLCEMTAI